MNIIRRRGYINIIMILRVIGWLLLVEAGFMLIPVLAALYFKETVFTSFLIGVAVTAGAGICLMSLTPSAREMGKREAILLTALVWVVFSLFGTIPLTAHPLNMGFTDAFFESMSGFTTTGLSSLPSIETLPRAVILWRCVMQWVGGMGIILFTLAVIPMLNYQGGMQMFNAEVSGLSGGKIRPRVSSTAKGLWCVYICLTLACALSLSFTEMGLFDAICYALTTLSTGGFGTTDMGIEVWDSAYIKWIFIIFMFLGGVNFALLFKAATGRVQGLWRNTALRWYAGVIACSTAIMAISRVFNLGYTDIQSALLNPLFQSVSIITSTGLVVPGFASWGAPALSLIVLMMFTGACAGSTTGGAKIDRIVLMIKNVRNEFYRIMHPNAVLTVRINGNGTSSAVVQKAVMFLVVFLMVIIVGGTLLVCVGIPFHDAYFSALESISNAGLAVNLEGTPTPYWDYPASAKWILSLIMLTGRLELYTVLLLFTSIFWKK